MPAQLPIVRWQLLSGRKKDRPNEFWGEVWHLRNWPDYVERSFAKAPQDLLEELRKMVAGKHTPKVEAGTKRGGKVNAIPSRPLGNLEVAKLNYVLMDYEKKWADMGPMGQALCKQIKAGKTRVVHAKRKLCRVAEVGGVQGRTPLFRVLKKTCGAPTRTPPSMTPHSHADLNAKTLTGKDDRKRKGSRHRVDASGSRARRAKDTRVRKGCRRRRARRASDTLRPCHRLRTKTLPALAFDCRRQTTRAVPVAPLSARLVGAALASTPAPADRGCAHAVGPRHSEGVDAAPCLAPQGRHADIREDAHRQLPPRRVPPSFRLSMQTRKATCTPPCKRPQSHADLKHTVDELKAENKKLKLTIDELGLDELRAESDKRDHTAIQELKAESTELKDENNGLERESEKLKREIEKSKAESAELKAESTELKDENNVLKRESEKLKGESEKLKAESAELKAENNTLERESEKPKQTIDELTQMVYKLKGEQEKSKHTIDELNSKCYYADEENWRLKKQNRGLVTQVHELVYGPGGQPNLQARVQHRQRVTCGYNDQSVGI